MAEAALDVEMRHAPALEVVLEARQRVFHVFHACAGLEVAVLQMHLGVSVGQHVAGLLSARLLVVLRHQHVALHAAAHSDFVVLCGGTQSQQTS